MNKDYKQFSGAELSEELVALEERLATSPSESRLRVLVQSLRVHQIELEMQNRELREAQRTLEETRDRYMDLYDFAPIGYMTLNAQGIIREINLTGARMLGQPRAELLDRPFASRLGTGHSKLFFRHLRRAFDDDAGTTVELCLQRKGTETLWITLESIRIRNDQSTVCRSAMVDITERREADQARRESDARLALIADHVPVLIAYVDRDMRYRFVNAAYRDWLGLDPERMLGRPVSEWMEEKTFNTQKPYTERALAGNEVSYENTINHQRLGRRDVSESLVPDRDQHGNINGYFSVSLDITERKRDKESEIRRLLDAAHADRLNTMGGMITEISHELNQPLTAIATTADVCIQQAGEFLDDLGNNQFSEALGEISAEAHRAAEIIKHVRSFAQRREATLVAVDLETVIDSALSLARVEKSALGVDIKKHIHAPYTVEADVVLIEQLIVNLARNAVDAMTSGGTRKPRITLTATDTGNYVEISIADNGPGLSAAAKEHLFDSFFTTKAKGLGLGLAICRSLVESHGGRIWTENPSEGGAKFVFTLNKSSKRA